ncbi:MULTISPECIES: response regulator transcription factor [unclassified Clostridioides]|uniref:response regulator transcription factor n=1 Tax=unclassified Clostridioides TaxID=2635829 RepID=UPI001D125CF1|nr:response regulator transcription factor [Clostridioides sp. ES-S-0171-01]MCC0687996.1 response regulator transcription factor [Clostridioides sp. ES-S-0056-01]MCC0715212.1 response regulator transcription factor [Clostridioides sp. ES-S-0077-01]UDN54911.1 response regulator transcription factor [Clostridioides sp. ES-S-0054-01]
MANTILVVEDDKEINNLLCKALHNHNYDTKSAFTGMQGLDMLKSEQFNMVLLDIMLPYKSGDKLLQELRSFSNIPVLVISAKETTQIKIDLLRLGADDYITKPFDIDEVVARIEANLRRNQPVGTVPSNILVYKDIKLDISAKQVLVNNQEITLTATEIRILELLLSQPQKVFSKANLFESIWNEEYTVDDNTLNVHISRLRQKLKKANEQEEYIETLWRLGYRLAK